MKTSNEATFCQSIQLYLMLAIPQITYLNDYSSTLDILNKLHVLRDELNDELDLDYQLEIDRYYLKKISSVTAVIVSTMRGYCNGDHQDAMINFRLAANAEDEMLDNRFDKAFMILTSDWTKQNVQDAMTELLNYIFELVNILEYNFSDTKISQRLYDNICQAI